MGKDKVKYNDFSLTFLTFVYPAQYINGVTFQAGLSSGFELWGDLGSAPP